MHIPRTLSTCMTGALGVMLLAGIVSVPTTATAATSSAVAPVRDAVVTIESDPYFAPGSQVHLSGTGPSNEWVEVDGLPTDQDGAPTQVPIDHRGVWTTSIPSDGASSYRITATPVHLESNRFTPIGAAIAQTLTADASYSIVERELSVTDGLEVRRGSTAVLSGVANAFTPVQVEFESGVVRTQADHAGRWSAESRSAVTSDQPVRVLANTDADRDFSAIVQVELVVLDEDGAPDPGDGEEVDPPESVPVEVTSDLTYLRGERLRITGTATPGAEIEVIASDSVTSSSLGGTVTASPETGAFEFVSDRNVAMPNGLPVLDVTVRQGDDETDLAFHSLQQGVAFRSTQVTSDTTYDEGAETVVSGTTSPHSLLSVRVADLGRAELVRADADGAFTFTTTKLAGPEQTVRIEQLFEAGETTEHVFTRRDDAPAITVATETFVKGQKQRIEGTAAPKARVNVYSGSKYLMNVVAGEDGKWSYTTGAVITTDTFTRTLKSDGAKDVTFTLTAVEQEQAAPITVATTSFVKGQKQLIEGTAAPKAKVNVYSGSKYLMHVIAGADGKWSYTTGGVITTDTFTRTLKSEGAKDVTFTLTAVEQEQTAPITVSTTTFAKGQKQLIEGTAAPKARVDVYSGSKYLMHVIAGADGKWSYTTGGVINTDTFTRTLKSAGTDDVTFTLTAK
ncbi:hypothetical protein [Curtobacterium sp. YR515]|uniref:hypothetical protein n=1 Tax=Curtobacterium sp. YR515 TaxID=1855316 RepID=UPI0008E80A83|nr:hypothetical protein [Curtobacterium sp. YR515]SFF50351.1 hypothetical protein SAMN05216329_1033 [Curtobacterium sp. YR515]